MNKFFTLYLNLFGKTKFRRLNYFFLKLGMRGLGFLNYRNFKESGESFILKKIIKEYKIINIFDVGAYHGTYSKEIIKLGFKLPIFSFEPHPENFSHLKEELKDFTNVYVENFGFSDQKEKAQLHDYSNSEGSSHATLYKGALSEIYNRETKTIDINLQTIDGFLTNKPAIKKYHF